jgi:hypothetical protein
MQICETGVAGDQGINWMPNLFYCSPLLNSFQQFISFVICFLVSEIIMGFNEWNLNMALYYGNFNFKTSFQFQCFALDSIIFGYNNISVIFFLCQIGVVLYPIPYSSPSIFNILLNLSWFIVLPTPYPLKHSNLCFVFDYISLFVAFFLFHYYMCVLGNMATFHAIAYSRLTIMVNNLRMISVSKKCLCIMFLFHLWSLHISKDALYDSNNLVLNLVY